MTVVGVPSQAHMDKMSKFLKKLMSTTKVVAWVMIHPVDAWQVLKTASDAPGGSGPQDLVVFAFRGLKGRDGKGPTIRRSDLN